MLRSDPRLEESSRPRKRRRTQVEISFPKETAQMMLDFPNIIYFTCSYDIVISDPAELPLGKYFKSPLYVSFQRQLNNYGFNSVASKEARGKMVVYHKIHGSKVTSAAQFIELRPLPSNFKRTKSAHLTQSTQYTQSPAIVQLGARLDSKIQALPSAPALMVPPFCVATAGEPNLSLSRESFRMVTPTQLSSYDKQTAPSEPPHVGTSPASQLGRGAEPMIIEEHYAPIHFIDDDVIDVDDDDDYAVQCIKLEPDTPCALDCGDFSYVLSLL